MKKITMFLSKILCKLSSLHIIRINDKVYIKLKFYSRLGQVPNLANPQTFNEKLQWLKLHNHNKIYTTMVDKYEAKKYVSNIIGKKHIIPTIGIYDRFEDIDFNKLPSKFVIKCTHNSGALLIVKNKDKIDIKSEGKKFNKLLKQNYYYSGREWPYKNVKPRIIVEKYMKDNITNDIRDYKFFCFNGKVFCFKIDYDRFINHRANYYDISGNLLPFGEVICPPDFDKKLNMPKKLNEMLNYAETLSKGIPFVRVDFYEINNEVYFGELTFYPASGFGKFTDDEWDYKLGNMINLNMVIPNEK